MAKETQEPRSQTRANALPRPGPFAARLLFCLLALLAWHLAGPALCAAAPAKGPIRVIYGFDREFPPFTFEEAGGEATGFEMELMKAIFAETEATLVPRPLQWDLVPLELSQGTITLTTGMVQTEQRAKLYLFSDKATHSRPDLMRKEDPRHLLHYGYQANSGDTPSLASPLRT